MAQITNMKLVYLLISLLWLFEASLARKKIKIPYEILSKDGKGWRIIEKSINLLKTAKIFPFDRNLMKRIALVESTLNRTTNEGGLWNVPSCAFWGVTQNRQKYGKVLKKIHKAVRRKFSITWSRMPYQELRRPVYSLIAARMYLHVILKDGIPRGANSQGKLWSTYYHYCGKSDIKPTGHLTKIFKKVVRKSCYSGYKKCEHYCIEVAAGRGECKCKEYFKLNRDGKSCKAVTYSNPCTLDNGKICEHSCLKSFNTILCTCPDGHYLHNNRYKCVDVNECNMSPCQHDCYNTPGSYHCSCFSGFSLQLDRKRCKADRRHDCSSSNDPSCTKRCVRMTVDGPCLCPPGMILDNDNITCIESNGCLTSEGFCHHSCLRTASGFSCACDRGYMLDSNSVTCTDIDECAIGEHACEKGCLNVPGGYRCTCPIGYKLNKDRETCSDINECLLKSNLCKSPSKCRNTKGDYKCECPIGYKLNLFKICVDVNECSFNNGGCEHDCHNVPGSVQCRCTGGYRLRNDTKTCEDIDECSQDNNCFHTCINTPGGYNCTCPPGMKDIDNGGLCL